MNFKPLHKKFKAPTKGTDGAGAYDLYMPEAGHIEDFAGPKVVKLGFAAAVPKGYVALLLPRSSTGFKFGLELNNTCGVIDSDYRGEWLASINTKSGEHFSWAEGARVLQMLIVPVAEVEINVVDSLDETERGEGGIGSTGE